MHCQKLGKSNEVIVPKIWCRPAKKVPDATFKICERYEVSSLGEQSSLKDHGGRNNTLEFWRLNS